MSKNIIIANWKMNLHYDEVKKLTLNIIKGIDDNFNDSKIILCVPFIYIQTVQELLKTKENVFVGAQNCNENQSGAFTGEVSCSMLNSIGIKYVIIGHSERREYYYESDDIIKKKISQAINNNIIPIFCFGETLEARENKSYFNYVESQIEKSLFRLNSNQISNIILAYEPVWAIGTGRFLKLRKLNKCINLLEKK